MNRYQIYFQKQVAERDKIFAKLVKAAPERSMIRPSSGAWCSSEIMQHLKNSETGVLHVLKKQVVKESTSFKTHRLGNTFRSMLLNASLISNFKFKAPAVVAETGEIETPENLLGQWNTYKQEMMDLLGAFPAELKNKLVFRHPVAGWLNLMETLQFMRFHQMHHMRQVVYRSGLL